MPHLLRRPRPSPRTSPNDRVHTLMSRFQLHHLESRYDRLVVTGLFSFVNGCLAIGLMALLALITRQAFIFPSLGPTAFLFFTTPLAAVASPRNTVYGHLIGVAAGWGSLALFGLLDDGPAIADGVSEARIGAAALSLGLTSGLMVLLRAPHPPAGATTLIISLGILREPWQMVILMIAVLLLTVQAIVLNRLAGLPYPLWAPVADS